MFGAESLWVVPQAGVVGRGSTVKGQEEAWGGAVLNLD